jgi:photosystem II stability/assembly factor-like uncharacterized protein
VAAHPDGTTYTNIVGATGESYTTPLLSRVDSDVRYRVIVNNATGQAATSNPAQITVTPDAAVLAAVGGLASGDNDKIRLQVAPGVLAGPTRFVFTPRTTLDGLPTGYTVVPGAAYDVTWSGAGFVGAREVAFGIRTAAQSTIASDRVRVMNTPSSQVAVHKCPDGAVRIAQSTEQGGYQGASATLCEGAGSTPTQVGLANPPPPPPPGAPWTQVGLPSLQRNLTAVAFAGPSVAVALGTDARYIRSVDGGASWTASTSPISTNESGGIAFADSNVGVIVAGRSGNLGRILRTTDAGVTWNQVLSTGPLRRVAFGSSTVGVAVGDSQSGTPARILRTTDGGINWTDSTISPGVGVISFTGVAFADASTVVVVGGGQLRRSTDGGQSFGAVTTPPPAVSTGAYRVAFGSSTVGVVVGFGSQVFWTADGGQTWAPGSGAALSTVTGFRDVTFLNGSTAIAVGEGVGARGVILRSDDGGKTWTAVDGGISGVIVNSAVAFANATTGVVTGDTGSVLRTTTGGL